MRRTWLLPLALLLVTMPAHAHATPVPTSTTPAPATPGPTSTTPAHPDLSSLLGRVRRVSTPAGGDGSAKGRGGGPAHARMLNLTPVYPMLDVTLGVLSYVAFAVYIVMLFGGYLSRANPLQEAVAAAIHRQGEALLEEGAATHDTINPALLQLLLGTSTAHTHRYHPTRLLTHMDLRDPSARLTHDTPGQSRYSGPARYTDLTGINSYSDTTKYDLLTHDRLMDRLDVFASDVQTPDARSDSPQGSAATPTLYTNHGLKAPRISVLSGLRPTSSAAYPGKYVNNMRDAASGLTGDGYSSKGAAPGDGAYSTAGGGSGLPLGNTLPNVSRVAPGLNVAYSQRYPGQVPGRIPGQRYQSWGQLPHWPLTSPSQYLKTPPTVLGGASHLSDAVTPAPSEAAAITVPASQSHEPHAPGLYPGQASQGVGAASQGQPGTGPLVGSTAPARIPGSPTLGYSLLPPRLTAAGLQTFAGSGNISRPPHLRSPPTPLVPGVRRPTPPSSVTVSLNTQAELPVGAGNLNVSMPHGAGYTQGSGKFSGYAGPLGGMWTPANRQPGLEGLDSLPLRPSTRYRSAGSKWNTPPTNHNQPDYKASSNGSTSNIKSKQGRVRPVNNNTTPATDNSFLVNVPSRQTRRGVSTTAGMATTNSTSVTNVRPHEAPRNAAPEPNISLNRSTIGTPGTTGHQTEGPRSSVSYASANDTRDSILS